MSEGLLKASLLLRVMAKALDFIVIAAAAKLVPRVGFLAGLAYLLISDGLFDGRSIGKKIIHLRVVSAASGVSGGFRASMIRNAPFAAAMLFLNIPLAGLIFPSLVLAFEFLLALGNSDGMRLGDDLAGTKVLEG
ncbi:MAG TPA: RDD family protein [Dissulfurispiraceae bacterium]|nr:RDD family protein [Dissulfurispiraceae bacterium]